MKNVKLGFINYLNTLPVYYGILTGKTKFSGSLVRDIPSNLNRMLREGELHISPVSSIEYALKAESYYLLKNFCINSVGYVRSVILVSKYPPEKLHGRIVGLTTASATSRALLKILFQDYIQVIPLYVDLEKSSLKHEKGPDAALLIGDEALEFNNPSYPYIYDIGNLWKEKTSFPVVFALWVVRRDFADIYPEKVRMVEALLEKSYEWGNKNKDGLIEMARSFCPDSVHSYEDYFKLLGYRFEEVHRKGLLFFYKKASLLGLCPSCEKLIFFE